MGNDVSFVDIKCQCRWQFTPAAPTSFHPINAFTVIHSVKYDLHSKLCEMDIAKNILSCNVCVCVGGGILGGQK